MTAAPSVGKNNRSGVVAMGGYFFLLMNVRIATIVVINESTNAENCNRSARVMYPILSPPSEGNRRKKEI